MYPLTCQCKFDIIITRAVDDESRFRLRFFRFGGNGDRNQVIIDFPSNLRRPIKLALNS